MRRFWPQSRNYNLVTSYVRGLEAKEAAHCGRRFRPQSRRCKLVSLNVSGMEAKEGTATAAKGSAIVESTAQQLRSRRKEAPVAFALQET